MYLCELQSEGENRSARMDKGQWQPNFLINYNPVGDEHLFLKHFNGG